MDIEYSEQDEVNDAMAEKWISLHPHLALHYALYAHKKHNEYVGCECELTKLQAKQDLMKEGCGYE